MYTFFVYDFNKLKKKELLEQEISQIMKDTETDETILVSNVWDDTNNSEFDFSKPGKEMVFKDENGSSVKTIVEVMKDDSFDDLPKLLPVNTIKNSKQQISKNILATMGNGKKRRNHHKSKKVSKKGSNKKCCSTKKPCCS